MDIPALAFWALALWAAVSRGNLFVALPWIGLPFGAVAVVSPSLTGGSSVIPITVAMLLFVVRVGMDRQNRLAMIASATQLRALGLLSLYTAYAVMSGYFLPRLLEGHVQVMGIRQKTDALYGLEPTSGNVTQSGYVLLSFLYCVALAGYLAAGEAGKRLQILLRGMYLGGAILAVTGLVDLLGGGALLDVFRTASYGNFGYTEVAGLGRIKGAYPEASAFGGASVFEGTFLLLAVPALRPGLLKSLGAPLLATVLILLAAASTSSTAYAGLGILAVCLVALGIKRFALGQVRGAVPVVAVVGIALVTLSSIFVWAPKGVAAVENLVDVTVNQKTTSISYRQRQYWNQTAIAAFVDSGGLGVGSGSQRASSWPLVILSNLGIPGALTMALFVILSILRHASSRIVEGDALNAAAKIGFVVCLSMSSLAGTVLDSGIAVVAMAAILLATSPWVPELRPAPRSSRVIQHEI